MSRTKQEGAVQCAHKLRVFTAVLMRSSSYAVNYAVAILKIIIIGYGGLNLARCDTAAGGQGSTPAAEDPRRQVATHHWPSAGPAQLAADRQPQRNHVSAESRAGGLLGRRGEAHPRRLHRLWAVPDHRGALPLAERALREPMHALRPDWLLQGIKRCRRPPLPPPPLTRWCGCAVGSGQCVCDRAEK